MSQTSSRPVPTAPTPAARAGARESTGSVSGSGGRRRPALSPAARLTIVGLLAAAAMSLFMFGFIRGSW